MTLQERLDVLDQLGAHLKGEDELLRAVMNRSFHHNQWFTIRNQERAIRGIAEAFLDLPKLKTWLSGYHWIEPSPSRRIGLVLAGNIPLVGFHDLLCVFVSGHHAMVKLSDKDKFLLPYLVKLMEKFDSRVAQNISFVPTLSGFEAVIATGSNNASRYFESYFGRYPHIIRKNRNGVGVLDGTETREELLALGEDIFSYFGLGCRNVAKLYLPQGYVFAPLLEALHEFREVVLHTKYKNNFDYNYAIILLNKVPYQANGCIILTENPALASPIAGLHYEYYSEEEQLLAHLQDCADDVQCVVGKKAIPGLPVFAFGEAQKPALNDYADGVDTLQFLLSLGA